MANYNVQITNGSGSEKMLSGSYSVTVSANGYDATSLSPTSYTATAAGGTGNFTVSANGVLTVVFNETGEQGGTPVTSGSVVMTDSTGETEYGSPVTVNSSGEAVFNNVPFNLDNPYQLHFKQLSSDSDHAPYSGVFTVGMGTETQTEYVVNEPLNSQTFTLTDANYSGLPVEAATLTFTAE